MSTSQAIQAHYEHYPYPTVTELQLRAPADHMRGTLNYLLRRRDADAIPKNARIWVAGCGTEQAVSWARRFPEGSVLGTDLSQRSLDISQKLAEQLGVRNLTLQQADLLAYEHKEPFDLVVSTGVPHHLPDPDAGLVKVSEVLSPNGAAFLMVYSRAHRGALQSFRRTLDIIAPPDKPGEERFAAASKLLDAVLSADRCAPLFAQVLEQLRQRRERDPAFVADALMNPLERCYDIDELLAWLDGAKLRHTSWYRPEAWDVGAYLEDKELVARIRQAPEREQWHAVYNLAGLSGPMLELLAEPAGQPERSSYSDEEILQMKPLWLAQINGYRVQEGRITEQGEGRVYQEVGDALQGRGLSMAYKWQLPAYTKRIFDACDGTKTIAQLQQQLDDTFAPADVLALIRQFFPDQLGLMVPNMG